MQKMRLEFTYNVYDKLTDLPKDEQELVDRAISATEASYSPYSKFRVGAAVQMETGEIITGCNIENNVYPLGLCAERVAVFSALSKYPNQKIYKIAIAASTDQFQFDKPVSPCGSCRQVLVEFETRQNKDIKIILHGNDQIYVVDSASSLLPLTFNETNLKL